MMITMMTDDTDTEILANVILTFYGALLMRMLLFAPSPTFHFDC